MDHVDRTKRSLIMAAVHSEDTNTEIAVRRIVHGLGYRYRLHVRTLPGRPDLVFSGRRKIIFVNGCFWHRHPQCRYATSPKTRQEFWQAKFAANVERDRRVQQELRRMEWSVMTIWQCELKKPEALARRLNEFLSN
jgi:DNA mismatch endonuclease, patch repair protein